MEKKNKVRVPKPWEAISVFLLILFVITVCNVFLAVDVQISLLVAVILSSIFALYLGYSLADIEKMIVKGLEGCCHVSMFNMFITLIIASWTACGIIPYIIYLGLGWITPAILPVMACLLCTVMSLITGSSWTTAGTFGIAFVSIGLSMNIPVGLVAGAVVSGALFGDKQSPLSETTVLAAGVSKTDLFRHVASMRYTSVPAIIIAILAYTIMGFHYAGSGNVDLSEVENIRTTLASIFHFTPLLLLVPAALIVLLMKKVNSTACLFFAVISSTLICIFYQGVEISQISLILMDGLKVESGINFIDELCSRGGLNTAWWIISLIMFGYAMGQILIETKVFDVVVGVIVSHAKSVRGTVLATLATGLILNAGTATPYVPPLLTGTMFRDRYDKLGVDRCVLSRTIEDATTIPLLVPWESNAMFFCSLLGCTFGELYPNFIMGYLCPILSVFCAVTGFGILYTNGRKGWGKDKYNPDIDTPISAEVTLHYYQEEGEE